MEFNFQDSSYCPLLPHNENAERYYNTFANAESKTSKHEIREATTATTEEEMMGDSPEWMKDLLPGINSSKYDNESTTTESSVSLGSTQSTTPNSEEISYCAVRFS